MARYTLWYDDKPSVPIQIRPQLVVRVVNMPLDITKDEADKICRVVRAYAGETGDA